MSLHHIRLNSLIVLFNREACQSLVVIYPESASQGALRLSCKRKALLREVVLTTKAFDQDPRGPVYGLLVNGTGQLALSVTGS